MNSEKFLRCVFIIYCTTVGSLLVSLPWTLTWDLIIAALPIEGLRVLTTPTFRGCLSGFGLVHLVWALHDLGFLAQPQPSADDESRSEATGH